MAQVPSGVRILCLLAICLTLQPITAAEGPLAVDRALVRDLPVTRALLWADGDDAWLPVDDGQGRVDTALDGDLRIELPDGWPGSWSDRIAGDMELGLRFSKGRIRLLVWAWSTTWRGHHLGLLRSCRIDGDRWHLEIDLEREFVYNYYNPQRVMQVVPPAHVSISLQRAGDRFTGSWTVRQGGFKSGVFTVGGQARAELTAPWPAQASDSRWPHAGDRPRLVTRAGAADEFAEDWAWLQTVWRHHDWIPYDPAADDSQTEAERSDSYNPADMELQRLWALPQDGEFLRGLATSAAVIDRHWQRFDATQKVQVRTWLLRNAEWAYVRSLEFPADSPWAGHYLGLAALCLCVVHGEHGDLQRQSFASNLVTKHKIIRPVVDLPPPREDLPEISIPAAHAFTDWLRAGPVPGTDHPELLSAVGGPVGFRPTPGGSIELAGNTYAFTRTGPEFLLEGAGKAVMDVGKLVDEQRDHTVLLYTIVDVPVRGICYIGMKIPGARGWLADVPVANDEYYRLEAGRYPFLVQCPIGPVVGPGKRRFPAALKIYPQPDNERVKEPYRQYLEREQLLTEPYQLAPRIEEGLRRWLDTAIGEQGTCRSWSQDTRLLSDSFPEVPLRYLLPAIAAWRQTFGRDLAAPAKVQAIGHAYLQYCQTQGRMPCIDVLRAARRLGWPIRYELPQGPVDGIGSRLPPRWHDSIQLPAGSGLELPTGLRADHQTGQVLFTSAGEAGTSLFTDAVSQARLGSPATSGHLQLRAWGADLLVAAQSRKPWLGRPGRGNRPYMAGSAPFLGGDLLNAETGGQGCRIDCTFFLRDAIPTEGWSSAGRTSGFLTGPGVDGRDHFRIDAFPDWGEARRTTRLQSSTDQVGLFVHDWLRRDERAPGDAGLTMQLHTGIGAWQQTATGWQAGGVDGPGLLLRCTNATASDHALPVPPGLHRLVLHVPDDCRWVLLAAPEGLPRDTDAADRFLQESKP